MLRMFSFPRKPGRVAAVATLLSLLATACVSPNDAGVRINPLSAELVFGAKKQEAPQVAGLQESSPLPEEIIYEEPFEEFVEEEAPAPRRNTAFVREEANIQEDEPEIGEPFVCYPYFTQPAPRGEPLATIRDLPPTGTVRWNAFEVIGAGKERSVTDLPPIRRLVRNVTQLPAGTADDASKAIQDSPARGLDTVPEFGSALFTYETVTPFGENFLVSTYQIGKPFVTPNALQNAFRVSSGVYRPRPPDAGVVLKKTEVVDAKGAPVPGFSAFAPPTGLMLLPLPATATEQFLSVAVDTNTGKTIRYEGVVNGIQRINACGEPVDGWSVSIFALISTPGETYDDATGNPCATSNSTTQGTSFPRCFQYDILVAPQHGGLIISEAVTRSPAQGLATPPFTTPKHAVPTNCDAPQASTTTVPGATTTTAPGATTTTAAPTTTTTLPVQPPPACVVASSSTIPQTVIVPPDEGGRFEFHRILGQMDPEAFSGDLTELRTSE